MSEDYVIEWDKNFADDLNVVANVFLSHNPTLWPTIFSQLSTQPEIFEDEDEDEYEGCRTSPDCSGGDPEITSWHRYFYKFLRGEGFYSPSLTGKVKMKKANWLILPQIAFMNSQKT